MAIDDATRGQDDAVIDVEDDPRQVQRHLDGAVRVYETELRPGESTSLHRHSRHTVFVYLRRGLLRCRSSRARHPAPVTGRDGSWPRRLLADLRFALRDEVRAYAGLVAVRSSDALPAVHRLVADRRNPSPMRFVGVEVTHGGGRAGRTEGMRVEYDDGRLLVLRLPDRGESAAELPRGGVLVCAGAPGTAIGARLHHLPEGGFARLAPGPWRFTGPSAVLVVL